MRKLTIITIFCIMVALVFIGLGYAYFHPAPAPDHIPTGTILAIMMACIGVGGIISIATLAYHDCLDTRFGSKLR